MWLWERYRPDVTGGNNCRLVLADTGRLIAMMPYTEYRERGISGQKDRVSDKIGRKRQNRELATKG